MIEPGTFYAPDTEQIEHIRKILTSNEQTIRLHMGELSAQEMRAVKAAFGWVLRELIFK